MLGFKSFRCASILITNIETMHTIKKGELDRPQPQASSAASKFYSLEFLLSADHQLRLELRRHCDRTHQGCIFIHWSNSEISFFCAAMIFLAIDLICGDLPCSSSICPMSTAF